MSELDLAAPVKRGDSGRDVRRVQEWLCLHGRAVQLDGEFGPATDRALKRFQVAHGLSADGLVGPDVFAALVAPMQRALAPIEPAGRSLGELTVAYAEQHLAQRAREVGDANSGPWVRLYMKQHEGRDWLWCAGFVSFVLAQAAGRLSVEPPLPSSFSCDVLGLAAKARRTLLNGDAPETAARVRPGSLFLVRRARDDWKHVGIVREAEGETFDTIEGNSNGSGGRNGVEVASNTRAYAGRDFVSIV